jgi:4-coumarate--CoA ligase
VIVSASPSQPANTVSVQSLMADDGTQFPASVKFNVRDDVCIIPYSSGTTGLPKGVMLTHYNVVAMMAMFGHSEFKDDLHFPDEQPIMLSFLPLYHVYGMLSTAIFALAAGIMVICLPRFHIEQILSCVQKYKVTILALVPPALITLSKSPLVKNYDLSSVRRIVCGAAPLSRDAELDFRKIVSTQDIGQGFGMTETTICVILNPVHRMKLGSVGIVLPNTEIKVIDIETKKMLGPHERGEICARGPQIMKGYLNNTKATAETIDSDGWLHTGDVGYYDDEGYFFIVDRIKELIKFKGFQVAPAELEALLLTHPDVADVAVIGVPDAEAGELPRAYIVAKLGMNPSIDNIKQFVADKVSNFKQLRGGVQFVQSIPKLETGKIIRRDVRNWWKSTHPTASSKL